MLQRLDSPPCKENRRTKLFSNLSLDVTLGTIKFLRSEPIASVFLSRSRVGVQRCFSLDLIFQLCFPPSICSLHTVRCDRLSLEESIQEVANGELRRLRNNYNIQAISAIKFFQTSIKCKFQREYAFFFIAGY